MNNEYCWLIHFTNSILQEKPLLHNTAEGVILTNRSLVLQGIDRTRSGGYTCQAINAVGSGQSQAIELDVKCKSNLSIFYWPTIRPPINASFLFGTNCDCFIIRNNWQNCVHFCSYVTVVNSILLFFDKDHE